APVTLVGPRPWVMAGMRPIRAAEKQLSKSWLGPFPDGRPLVVVAPRCPAAPRSPRSAFPHRQNDISRVAALLGSRAATQAPARAAGGAGRRWRAGEAA